MSPAPVSSRDGVALQYPEQWNQPSLKAKVLHATAAVCCEKIFPGQPCQRRDCGCGGGDDDDDGSAAHPPTTPVREGNKYWHLLQLTKLARTHHRRAPPVFLHRAAVSEPDATGVVHHRAAVVLHRRVRLRRGRAQARLDCDDVRDLPAVLRGGAEQGPVPKQQSMPVSEADATPDGAPH